VPDTLAPMQPTDLAYAGAAEQARLIRDREASARELVEATLAQIDRLDSELRAYRVVFAERALAEADAYDAGKDDKPLGGVPVAIKDDADVAGEITAWGPVPTALPRPSTRTSSCVFARPGRSSSARRRSPR